VISIHCYMFVTSPTAPPPHFQSSQAPKKSCSSLGNNNAAVGTCTSCARQQHNSSNTLTHHLAAAGATPQKLLLNSVRFTPTIRKRTPPSTCQKCSSCCLYMGLIQSPAYILTSDATKKHQQIIWAEKLALCARRSVPTSDATHTKC
jgi:hypothetical protein